MPCYLYFFIGFQTNAQSRISDRDATVLLIRYYQLHESVIAPLEKRIAAKPDATLAKLESQPFWICFPKADYYMSSA
ncbi:MAG: hypothetical protein ABIO77_06250, partial [Ginsengibacter sp.]